MHLSCAAVTLVALSLLTLASAAEGDDETKVADNSASSTAFSLPAFTQAFGESFAVILATEIGDRTFFIAAIMAMRHSRLVVWAGAVGALAVMTVLSTLVGHVAPLLIPKQYTHYMAAALFLYFGLKMLRESFSITHAGASEELEEVEGELCKKEEDMPADEESSQALVPKEPPSNRILVQAFTLTFVAEWGDRSQIATIALAAVREPFGVTLGAVIGHALCTGVAVIGGKLLASSISERTVLRVGGVLFCLFAVFAVMRGPSD